MPPSVIGIGERLGREKVKHSLVPIPLFHIYPHPPTPKPVIYNGISTHGRGIPSTGGRFSKIMPSTTHISTIKKQELSSELTRSTKTLMINQLASLETGDSHA